MNRQAFALVVTAVVITTFALTMYHFRDPTGDDRETLVVYCAHDSVYSQEILDQFEAETGIDVEVVHDSEATKSLGLVQRIIREKENPRCDVFWNNQVLGTLDLEDEGLLIPYKGPGYERIPSQYKSVEGTWTGFAARLRVVIVNTDRMSADDAAIAEAMNGDLSEMAIAKPLYGTTRTHFTVLWNERGAEKLPAWYEDIQRRNVRIVDGNATVKDQVASGSCRFGWTDTDDFFVGKDAGHPVEMRPVRTETGATICIPNSVAIIRGTRRMEQAKRLIDFLLSQETELALARSRARQIPLGAVEAGELPEDVRPLKEWAADGYDLSQLGTSRGECLQWLKAEHLK